MYSQLGKVILMGDFNAHLNGTSFIKHIDSRGAALRDLINLFNLSAITTLQMLVMCLTMVIASHLLTM